MSKYSLLNRFEISRNNEKLYWTEAKEWQDDSGVFADIVKPDDVFTDYHHGECEVFNEILLLRPSNNVTGDEGDSSQFTPYLEGLPIWTETMYVVLSLGKLPGIYNCKTGDLVSYPEAMDIMEQLGYFWNPEKRWFQEIESVMEVSA